MVSPRLLRSCPAIASMAKPRRRPALPSGMKRQKLAKSTTASAWDSTSAGSRWTPMEWAITTRRWLALGGASFQWGSTWSR